MPTHHPRFSIVNAEATLPSRLFALYDALDPEQKVLIDILALNWGPLTLHPLKLALGIPARERLDLSPLEAMGLIVKKRLPGGAEGYRCAPPVVDLVMRALAKDKEGFEALIEVIRAASPFQNVTTYQGISGSGVVLPFFASGDQFVREIRIGFYLHDQGYIDHMLRAFRAYASRYYSASWQDVRGPDAICVNAILNPLDASWFLSLPDPMRFRFLPAMIMESVAAVSCDSVCLEDLRRLSERHFLTTGHFAVASLLCGDDGPAKGILASDYEDSPELMGLRGVLELLQGAEDFGITSFDAGLRLERKQSGDKQALLTGVFGVFHAMALLLRRNPKDITRLKSLLAQADFWARMFPVYRLLPRFHEAEARLSHEISPLRERIVDALRQDQPNIWLIWFGLTLFLRVETEPQSLREFAPVLSGLAEGLWTRGLVWPAAELENLLGRIQGEADDKASRLPQFRAERQWTLLSDRIQCEAPWERTLRAIESRFSKTASKGQLGAEASDQGTMRLTWRVVKDYGVYTVEAREHKKTARGWSKGKVVALKNLKETADRRDYLSEQDLRVIPHIGGDEYWYGYRLQEAGWRALDGHPALFDETGERQISLSFSTPEIRIQRMEGGRVKISLWPLGRYKETLVFTPQGRDHIEITPFREDHHRLQDLMGSGFDAPEAAHEQLIARLKSISSLVTVHSELGETSMEGGESFTAVPTPHVQLTPEGEGLWVHFLVRPFGHEGAFFKPGEGPKILMTAIDGKRFRTQRDHPEERRLAGHVIAGCPTLERVGHEEEPWRWQVDDSESALELLLELQSLPQDSLDIEWPKGEAIRMVGEGRSQQFKVRVTQQRDWFQLGGELELDNGEVVLMQTLLELTRNSQSRFVRLEGDRILALTDAFRKRIEDLRTYSEKHGKGQRIHPLALPILERMAPEFGAFETDEAFKERMRALTIAENLQTAIPSTLQATLRDYQQAGFRWLTRLASLGVGACLADDMGLGKTLQAIALILERAPSGPTLVVAPTSVLFNWEAEIQRFAPTLRSLKLAGDREAMVSELGPFDVLIVSYGLMQQESVAALLSERRFNTLILDEAQAIKNAGTRRSQSVMALQGDFRLIMTGTPLENHLGELWNLFRFINPGLLGSEESFNQRFAHPIERNASRDARLRLKQLVQPFILRRTKTEVLQELPERTEIELKVVLGPREAALYEALRRDLLNDLEAPVPDGENQRFKVLAAIMKLRRACCNPNLVAPELGLPSSKLELLGTVLDELLDNRHKALVFSQFVDHLALVRAELERRGIAYQYLDGQTAPSERKRSVEAFQKGEGDVFLISLKAGGSGLNLTAADYVIHLDPWWNPAVEDQASSRAHRMGQERPVTVYRLVTEGTIEEQIMALHKSKRDLADSLLEGGDTSGRLDTQALVQLIQENLAVGEG